MANEAMQMSAAGRTALREREHAVLSYCNDAANNALMESARSHTGAHAPTTNYDALSPKPMFSSSWQRGWPPPRRPCGAKCLSTS